MCCLQNSMISCLGRRLLPGFSVTKALGRSPHFSSGMATTAHSITAGCRATHCSTSMVGDVLAARDDDVLLRGRAARCSRRGARPRCRRSGTSRRGRPPPCASGLLEVALHHVVADHDDLAQRLAVARDVAASSRRPRGPGRRWRSPVPAARPGAACSLPGQPIPFRMPRADGMRAVGLGEPVDVHRAEVELLELAQQASATAARPPPSPSPGARGGAPGGWLTTPICTVGAPL